MKCIKFFSAGLFDLVQPDITGNMNIKMLWETQGFTKANF